jgi:hypothetical protein
MLYIYIKNMTDKHTTKASWVPLQLRNDAREALDDLRRRDYPKAKSYSEVILALVSEHKSNHVAE